MNQWELNAIVLAHRQRFFSAATAVVRRWRAPNAALVRALVSTLGDLSWAGSPFLASSRSSEKALAYGGAVTASLGPWLASLGSDCRDQALVVVSLAERRLVKRHDELLATLLARVEEADIRTPGEVNGFVWEQLFPNSPWGVGTPELEEHIAERIDQLLG